MKKVMSISYTRIGDYLLPNLNLKNENYYNLKVWIIEIRVFKRI